MPEDVSVFLRLISTCDSLNSKEGERPSLRDKGVLFGGSLVCFSSSGVLKDVEPDIIHTSESVCVFFQALGLLTSGCLSCQQIYTVEFS